MLLYHKQSIEKAQIRRIDRWNAQWDIISNEEI